jgi:hypothetical protein
MMMDRKEINAFGDRIKALLLDGDEAVLTAVGARSVTPDCDEVSALATVRGMVGKQSQEFTGNGMDLESAIWLARGKLRDARAAHARALEKAKADKQKAA